METSSASHTYLLIEDHASVPQHRSGEGAVVELKDGRLLLLYSAFRGGGFDHSPGEVWRRVSEDGGITWGAPEVLFKAVEGALNVMSVSLLRLQDGRIGCVYVLKWTSSCHLIPYWTVSSDEGETWSPPVPMIDEKLYICVNNDRLIQLRDGTLVVPYCIFDDFNNDFKNNPSPCKPSLNGACGIFYSKDGGQTWHRPNTARRFDPAWFVKPEPFRPEEVEAEHRQMVDEQYDVFQEPGVVELKDGRIMMWARSHSHIFYSFIRDLDGAWCDFKVIEGFNVCLGPQTIKRLPSGNRLIMFYNDRGDLGFGEPAFANRTPLNVAYSDDEGATWHRSTPLETDTLKNYCYFSLLFFGDSFLTTYYESVQCYEEDGSVVMGRDGTPHRRNLASLKACIGKTAFFENAGEIEAPVYRSK